MRIYALDRLCVGVHRTCLRDIDRSVDALADLSEADVGRRVDHTGKDAQSLAVDLFRSGRYGGIGSDSGDLAVLNNDRAILDRRPRNGDDPRTDDRKRSAAAGLILF